MFIAQAMLTKPAHTFSALQALLMAASAGSFATSSTPDFILDKRVIGGLQQVPLRLAERLGDAVRTRPAGVEKVVWTDARRHRVVRRPDGQRPSPGARDPADRGHPHLVRAAAAASIQHADAPAPLDRARHQGARAYETPFWREQGLSGTAFSPYEVVHEAYDNTNHDEARGTLVGFVSDLQADAVFALSADERKERILASLSHYYGPEATNPLVVLRERLELRGAGRAARTAASFDIGGLTRYGADLREPVGPIHFGAATSPALGYQHVDGALRVGAELAGTIIGD